MKLTKTFKNAIVGSAIALAFAGNAQAAVTYDTGTGASEIPALTGFATTGGMMSGLSVTAFFASGTSETRIWSTTGADSGGVTGTGWSLTQSGDTWNLPNYWNFSLAGNVTGASSLSLVSLLLSGNAGFTVFDRSDVATTPAMGTDGSYSGRSVVFSDNAIDAWVTYSDEVNLAGQDAVGDLFHELLISFDNPETTAIEARSGNFAFMQDTDNDSRYNQTVPEPGMLGLIGLALAGFAWTTRRR